ncbi:MAG: chemotaxis-specific protein-glutamate methyltransferase CheB [Candidatus Omnitrophota bacterium]
MQEKIRVLIVEDSVFVRQAIKSVLNSDPDIQVIGTAKDGKEAIEKNTVLKPNVITMDINMPEMSGLEAIERIMEEQPVPIVVVSSMDVNVVIKALAIGAMDFVSVTQDIEQVAKDLIEKVKISSRVKPLRRMKINASPVDSKLVQKKEIFRIVAVGISTGGPQALEMFLSNLPKDFPAGILIVQHISKGFIDRLAEWLNLHCPLDVRVAKAGETLKSSTVLIAADDYNLTIYSKDTIVLSEGAKNALHVPSIDVMMKSVADVYGEHAIGVVMTGMGYDGVEGIRAIKNAGGVTIAQDEKSSAIFGMNKAAIETGCVDKIVSLDKIAGELIKLVGQGEGNV